MDRSIPACWPVVVWRSAGVTRTATSAAVFGRSTLRHPRMIGGRAGHSPPVPSPSMAPWTTDLPRFPLLDGPSPLQPLPRFSAEIGGAAEVWIKREDLLPLAFGGNKLRNLEFLVGQALADGADTLVTSGRRWSNHARLTAAAGARAGLGVHLVLSGPPVDRRAPTSGSTSSSAQ